jgi:uroporphyrinogen decarboxylase
MTSIERMSRILQRKPVDRIGVYEAFWGDTRKAWAGRIPEGESYPDHFGLDLEVCGTMNLIADMDFKRETVAEDDDTVTYLDGNGATLRRHKHHDSTPEHVDFKVKEREAYVELIHPRLKENHRRRINFEGYRNAKAHAVSKDRFFCWSIAGPFEQMHPVCGHEHMLAGMALDPEWIAGMAMDYAKLTVALCETLFAEEGLPDGAWIWEDMGFKHRPFMSPAMYGELVQPAHAHLIGYLKSKGLPVIMHSCGFVEPLIPGMLEAGIDMLQVIEIKAGMDPFRIKKQYGDRLSLMGGIDVRTIYTNDRAAIDKELEAKIPALMAGGGYALHSDHSIPNTVAYDTYRYFIEKGLQLGTYR